MQHRDLDADIARARTDGVLKDIVIPPCPELLLALRKAVDCGDPEPQGIAQIANADVAMAAALLKVANSPVHGRSQPVRTVTEAISVLGLSATIGLLMGFLTRHALPVNSPLVQHFWETSNRRGLAMAFIARQLYGISPELAQTCGLFLHVGIPILLQGVKGYSGTLSEAMARQDRTFTETENAVHRTDHAVVGAIVARTWHLPAEIALAVRYHHDHTILCDSTVSSEVRALVALSAVADHFVANFEGVERQPDWVAHGDTCLEHLQIGASEMDVWVDVLDPIFSAVADV